MGCFLGFFFVFGLFCNALCELIAFFNTGNYCRCLSAEAGENEPRVFESEMIVRDIQEHVLRCHLVNVFLYIKLSRLLVLEIFLQEER